MKTAGLVLGVGAPNECKDGRKTSCAIVLCFNKLGLIRVYPIPGEISFPVWAEVSLDLERHPKDNRAESYGVRSFEIGRVLTDPTQKREILNECILKSGAQDPLDFQNERRKSIALVKLEWGALEMVLSQRVPEAIREDDELSWLMTQGRHWNKPYVQWRSIQGGQHKTHLVGREVYEGLRKNPDQPWDIFNYMRLNSPDFEIWMLLGNMRDRRNVWVCPHVHRLKRAERIETCDMFGIRSQQGEAWPYETQEAENVEVIDNQLGLFTEDLYATR